MKHGAWKTLSIVILVSSLAFAGCDRKKEASAPAEPASAPEAAAPSVNMQDGQWEITTRIDMPGMPAEAMKPHTVKTCLTKDKCVPEADQQQTDCTMKDQKVDGNTVSWTVVCKDTTGTGTITYAGDTFNGQMESSTRIEGKVMKTKMADRKSVV